MSARCPCRACVLSRRIGWGAAWGFSLLAWAALLWNVAGRFS